MLDRSLIKHIAFFGLTLLSLQGTIYLLQILAAARMSTADYSQVRVIESLVAVIALLSTIGIPSIALVKVANSRSVAERKLLVRHCLILVGIFVIAISFGFVCALHLGLLQQKIDLPLPLVLALSAFISFRLLLVSTTQAFQEFGQLAIVSVFSCIITIVFFELTKLWAWAPVLSWMWARIILEAIVCLGLFVTKFNFFKIFAVFCVKTYQKPVVAETPKILFLTALPVGISLILRSIVEHGPILWLASINAPVSVIAEVGFILTLGTIAIMPSGIIQGVILPKLSIVLSEKNHDKKAMRQLIFLFIASSGATAIIFATIAGVSLFFIPLGKFITTVVILAGVTIVISKVIASALGGYLLASSRRASILAINFFAFLLCILAAMAFEYRFSNSIDLVSVLWVIALIETCATACYINSSLSYNQLPSDNK